jgi:hypothetical protein
MINTSIQKAMSFYRIYDSNPQDPMRKPNGDHWKNENEIWECWSGFAGSEDKAKRICQTLEAGFRPLAGEMTIHQAISKPLHIAKSAFFFWWFRHRYQLGKTWYFFIFSSACPKTPLPPGGKGNFLISFIPTPTLPQRERE